MQPTISTMPVVTALLVFVAAAVLPQIPRFSARQTQLTLQRCKYCNLAESLLMQKAVLPFTAKAFSQKPATKFIPPLTKPKATTNVTNNKN